MIKVILIVDVMASDIRKMNQMGRGEFDYYAIRYVNELLYMKWTANHYRFGNKMPGEKGWDKDEERNND